MPLRFIRSIIKSTGQGIVNDPEIKKVMARYPRFFSFVKKRITPNEQFGLHLTLGMVSSAIFIFLFFGVLQDVIGREPMIEADLRIINLIQIFHTPWLNQIMLLVTYLGNWQVVFLGLLFVSCYLFVVRGFYYLAALLVSVGVGELFVWLVKYAVARPRPPLVNALYLEQGFSFPSGHMFVALAFYGLVAYFIFRRQKNLWAKLATIFASLLLAGAVGFSRIYLGVHWPSDVLASLASGLALLAVLITAIEIRSKFNGQLKKSILMSRRKIFAASMIMLVAWFSYWLYFFASHPLTKTAVLLEPEYQIINQADIPEKLFQRLPKNSENIIGVPMEPVNLIIIARRGELIKDMRAKGWLLTDSISVKTLWRMVITAIYNRPYPQAPGTPMFWNSRPNDFAFEQPTAEQSVRERHHVHFWETPFRLADGRAVWFATAHFDKTIELSKNFFPAHAIDPAIDKERDKIKADLMATGQVSFSQEFGVVEPTLGRNQAGDLFFTDGKAAVIFLPE